MSRHEPRSDRIGRRAAGPCTQSRHYCEQLTRTQAKNFYYGLKLLPEPKRSAMFALYAYMRLVDDIADDEGDGGHAGRTVQPAGG